MISKQELELARKTLDFAKAEGAQACRVVLNKSESNILDSLCGELDKISHCLDRSLSLSLFIDGKYASFSTNRLEEKELADFTKSCAAITRMLEQDPCRKLPERERCCEEAQSGLELELYDPEYETLDEQKRKSLALQYCLDMKQRTEGYRIISEEGEYCDSEFDSISLDSQGLFCRHRETSFEYASEVTVEGEDGTKSSSYWWTSSSRLKELDYKEIGQIALRRAVSSLGAGSIKGGKYRMVVDSNVASKLLTPLLNALNGFSLQQNNSFLMDSLGQKVFSEKMNLVDRPHIKGESGSRLFDSEGVRTKDMDIIRNGIVNTYFINTYIAEKTGFEPTVEDSTRVQLLPYPEQGLSLEEILQRCGEGILVSGFNGGNSNSATGDFSYGVEGFEFKDGKIGKPVSGMLITGNFIDLWKHLLYAGADYRPCMSKLIPSLAFEDVSFSGE